jgi:hypothetical protein
MAANDRGQDITGHFQLVYPTEYIKAPDLRGKDVTVTIARVAWENLVMEGGRRDRKAVIHMTNARRVPLGKRWVVGKTVLKQIAASVGSPDVSQWIGRQVTMYPTTCKGKAGETMECIRVRVRVSQAATEIPEDMAQAPAPRSFLDEAEADESAPPEPRLTPPTVSEAQALANRANAARSESEITTVALELDAAKGRLRPAETKELRALIASRREALAGVVNPDAEPPPGQP